MTTTNDTTADWLTEFFGEPIHVYTRAQAVADGVLIDVTETARQAGFRLPVALTFNAHAAAVAWDEANGPGQDTSGRLWDVIWMARLALAAIHDLSGDRAAFGVWVVPNRPGAVEVEMVALSLLASPGDDGTPVLTICLRDED